MKELELLSTGYEYKIEKSHGSIVALPQKVKNITWSSRPL